MTKKYTIDPRMEQPIRITPDGYKISAKTAYCYNKLLSLLQTSGYQPITLTMRPSGDKVTIAPFLDPSPEQKLPAWYNVNTPVHGLNLDTEDLVQLAAKLCDYEKEKQNAANEVQDLQQFYKNHIENHTKKEIRKAEDIHLYIIKHPDETVETVCEHFPMSEQEIKNAVTLSENYAIYSDWHKYLFHVRPR